MADTRRAVDGTVRVLNLSFFFFLLGWTPRVGSSQMGDSPQRPPVESVLGIFIKIGAKNDELERKFANLCNISAKIKLQENPEVIIWGVVTYVIHRLQ